ncbi:MAG: tetratricopeptide repeat protein, partial [Cyanobacteria bacterium J06641_5]
MFATLTLEKGIALGAIVLVFASLGVLFGKTWGTSRRFQAGVRKYDARDYDDAIEAFEAVIARQPSNDLARLLLGNSHAAQGDFKIAIATFEELVARSPKNVDGYLSWGKALLRQGETDAAVAQFRAAAAIKPKRFPEPHVVLGLALKDIGDREGAIAALEAARAIYTREDKTQATKTIAEELAQLQAKSSPAQAGTLPESQDSAPAKLADS